MEGLVVDVSRAPAALGKYPAAAEIEVEVLVVDVVEVVQLQVQERHEEVLQNLDIVGVVQVRISYLAY